VVALKKGVMTIVKAMRTLRASMTVLSTWSTRMTKTMLARYVIYAASYVYIHEIQKKSFINCLVSAYIALCLNDNHRDQQKSTRLEEADGGPVGYHGFR
jgi:hypothetical protein